MLDIYSYINSPDVAAHCREINKTWTPFEMAVIVGRSKKTMSDKHAAWRQIAADYPDMPTPKNMHVQRYDSLHHVIATVIAFEENALSLFNTPDPSAVYMYKVKFHDEYRHSDIVFTTFENTLKDIKESYERDEPESIIVNRVSVDSSHRIEVFMDYDGNPYYVILIGGTFDKFSSFLNISKDFNYDIFEYNFFIDIPIPFKRGDILTIKSGQKNKDRIFVYDSSVFDNPERYERRIKDYNDFSDGTDLMGWGYFVSENGDLYGDHAGQYDNYEYYRGNLDGDNKLLHYVSIYIKDEISLPDLLAMQCRILLQHQLENDLRVDIHGRFIPEYLQAENRIANDEK